MGGFALTNPGIQYEDQQPTIDPQTGQPMPVAPRVQFFKNSAARNKQYLADTEAAVAKTPLTVDPETGAPVMSEPNMPHPVQPKFSDLSSPNSQTGEAQPISSGETKLGKLLHILTSAARGAAMGAGQPNFGAGFEQAQVRPLQIASMRQGLQQQQAQTALTRSQSTMVPTPYGPMPAGLAKAMFPALINSGSRERVAQTAATSRENVADTAANSRENVAQTNKRYMPTPMGLYDTQSQQLIKGTENGILVTPEIAQEYDIPADFIGKPMKLSDLASNKRADVFQNTVTQGASGPALVNRKTGKTTSLGLGNPGMGRPLQVGDPNNPGETTYATGAEAIQQKLPGTQSASVQVPRTAAKAEVPTKIGDLKVAFTTAIQHAEMLREAARALGNGDIQTLSGLKNRFNNEFGSAGPITAQAIADAYGGEVTAIIAKGHMTDKEIEKTGKTINPQEQNYETIDKVLRAYQSLAQSKMNMLNQQEQNAIKNSQPKKNGGMNAVPAPQTHVFNPSAWKLANPNGDVNAAIAFAKSKGYQIKQ